MNETIIIAKIKVHRSNLSISSFIESASAVSFFSDSVSWGLRILNSRNYSTYFTRREGSSFLHSFWAPWSHKVFVEFGLVYLWGTKFFLKCIIDDLLPNSISLVIFMLGPLANFHDLGHQLHVSLFVFGFLSLKFGIYNAKLVKCTPMVCFYHIRLAPELHEPFQLIIIIFIRFSCLIDLLSLFAYFGRDPGVSSDLRQIFECDYRRFSREFVVGESSIGPSAEKSLWTFESCQNGTICD